MLLMEDFTAKRIEELCKKRNISKYRLAQLTGISQSSISYLVNKTQMPTLLTLEKICNALDITMAKFFTVDENFTDLTFEQKEILDSWDKLDYGNRKVIKALFKVLNEEQ